MLVRQAAFHRDRDVAELRVAVRMVVPLLGLPVALETVVEVVQQLGDLRVADRMVLPGQCLRNCPRALTGPAQRRCRVAPRLVLDHGFQRVQELRIGHRDRFATRSRAAMRPAGNTTPCRISPMPLATALRDRPHARLTRLTPPWPTVIASLAAMRRRARSSNNGHTARNFALSSARLFTPEQHSTNH